MTREEAKGTDLKRLDIKYANGDREFQISSMKVYRLIDEIYDDFEHRTCENCKYYNICSVQEAIDNSRYIRPLDFGCNKFERKG